MRFAIVLLFLAGCSTGPGPTPQQVDLLELDGMTFRRVSPARYGKPGPDFFLLETEVSNAEYARYLEATGKKKPDEELEAAVKAVEEERRKTGIYSSSTVDAAIRINNFALLWRGGKPPTGTEEHPVSLLSVHEASGFCEWLTKRFPKHGTFRFPTVEEWVTAAYGAGRPHPWGEGSVPPNAHFSGSGPEGVRARAGGRSSEGIYGLWGNVSEFVIHPEEVHNVTFMGVGSRWMGGGYSDPAPQPRQDYWGYWHSSEGRSQAIGFRVLLDPADREHKFKHQTPYDRPARR